MTSSFDFWRLALAATLALGYGAMCVAIYRRYTRRHAAGLNPAPAAADWIVAYASQTGSAEELANRTADVLRLAGIVVDLLDLSHVSPERLKMAERILFVVSTHGEGDAPDNGAVFADRCMLTRMPLWQLHYGVLALGDRSYAEFCGFGRALDHWLQEQGAQRLFGRIEVDRSAGPAIDGWFRQLSHLAGTSDAPDWSAPAFTDWRLAVRCLLNPGSAGAPVYHLELEPTEGALPSWESGDLVQIAAPDDPERPREFSVASMPADGRVHLLVRLHSHPDGSFGAASGWLCMHAGRYDTVRMRLRSHRRFRLEDNALRPLILIGNGSGIAGLRGHLKARALNGARRTWLFFGERNAFFDFHYREDIEAWRASGVLDRVDMVFSRDQEERRYVQDRLPECAEAIRTWVEQGAAIYVCGSLAGMAGGVDHALAGVLGRTLLDQMSSAGRYRRDVY